MRNAEAGRRLAAMKSVWPVLLALFAAQALAQPPQWPVTEKAEARIAELVNQFRDQSGRERLVREGALDAASRRFAQYMARTGRYGHEADGREPAARAEAQGYAYCMVAENIAYQYRSDGFALDTLTRGFVKGWIDSPNHRANMLEPIAVETGIGIARSEKGVYYAVQMFGRPHSMRISFQVENRSGSAAQYRLGGRSFPLPARATRTHEQCAPAAINLDPPGAAPALIAENGSRYVILSGGRLQAESVAASK